MRPGVSLLELLDLERVEQNFFRGRVVFDDPLPLYGGQVLAQALRAAGTTVDPGRLPHSLHGYFLRPGDATRPTFFRVDRDRDGRSFSARRVVAIQSGEVILNMACSFHVNEQGEDVQDEVRPAAPPPDELPDVDLGRLVSMQARVAAAAGPGEGWPTRFWARCTEGLSDDALLHACVLTYLSDISTGMAPYFSVKTLMPSTLDHSVWFHRDLQLDDWVLVDLVPRTASGGRGWYTGTVHDSDARLGASLAQESLFRSAR
jgi:acyl-CoA thioesterase-2